MSSSLPVADDGDPPDTDLLDRVRQGDHAAFGQLYERDASEARRVAARLVPPSEVGDVVSEAFMRVLLAIQNGAGPRDEHLPYLLVAVRSTVYDRYRRRPPLPVEHVAELPSASAEDSVSWLIDARLTAAFENLPQRWRLVLWWSVVEDASVGVVGGRLGISASAAAALTYRARSALREAYARQAEVEERSG